MNVIFMFPLLFPPFLFSFFSLLPPLPFLPPFPLFYPLLLLWLCDFVWPHELQVYCCMWLRAVACGCVWLRVASCGCVRLRVAACGCVWLRAAACGCVWLHVAACGVLHTQKKMQKMQRTRFFYLRRMNGSLLNNLPLPKNRTIYIYNTGTT